MVSEACSFLSEHGEKGRCFGWRDRRLGQTEEKEFRVPVSDQPEIYTGAEKN